MLIKNIHNTLLITLLLTSTMSISGCTTSPSLIPISKVQKDFKNDFDVKTLSNVIANAAKEKDWNILNQTPTSMNLKKTFKKARLITTQARWKRVTVDHDIYVNVNMNQKSFKISLADQSEQSLKTDSDRELFNENLGNLEKAIYVKLTEVVL